MQFALVAGAVAVASALLVPVIYKGNPSFTASSSDGIDRTVTGSIDRPVKRYHIRRSILDNDN